MRIRVLETVGDGYKYLSACSSDYVFVRNVTVRQRKASVRICKTICHYVHSTTVQWSVGLQTERF